MIWWGLVLFLLVVPFLLYGLFRWASSDKGIDRELSKDGFRAEQELRGLRRSGGSERTPEPPTKTDSSEVTRFPVDTFSR